MSTFTRITRNPQSGKYEQAIWHDDYYGHHLYGVEFPSDGKVYPTDMVNAAHLFEFWSDDVMQGFRTYANSILKDSQLKTGDNTENMLERFLAHVNQAYKNRWKRDKLEGEGAVQHERSKHERCRAELESATSKNINKGSRGVSSSRPT